MAQALGPVTALLVTRRTLSCLLCATIWAVAVPGDLASADENDQAGQIIADELIDDVRRCLGHADDTLVVEAANGVVRIPEVSSGRDVVGEVHRCLADRDHVLVYTIGPDARRALDIRSFPRERTESSSVAIIPEMRHALQVEVLGLIDGHALLPRWTEGQLDGFELPGISPGTALYAVGLRPHDVIRRVGGHPLSSPDELILAATLAETGKPVVVTLDREGRETILRIVTEASMTR